jgi:hypothetical protein
MQRFDELLKQEMTRKEFVAKLGLALLAVVGLPALLGIFSKSTDAKKDSGGFGSGVYR